MLTHELFSIEYVNTVNCLLCPITLILKSIASFKMYLSFHVVFRGYRVYAILA